MAVYKRDIVDINLETGNIHRSFLKHSIGYMDQKADHFGVRVFRNGEPVNLTGVSVQGVFMPPQGSPIAITTGNIVSDNVAEVVLPQACYNYDGQFTLAIKLVDSTNEVTGTVRIVDGMVDNTHASGTVAPTSAVPTYQEVLSAYEQAIAVIGASVRFDQTQSLTDAQKATARSNIGAPSTAEMNTALALKVNVSDIENDLTGTTAGKVLDARQGKVLDDKVSAEIAARQEAVSAEATARENADATLVPKTTKVNGHALSSDVTLTKGDVGLGNVDNTSDANKPVSTAQQEALDLKVDKANIENDLTGTTAGYVLDARQGKVLDDKLTDVKSAINAQIVPVQWEPSITSGSYYKTADGSTASSNKYARTTILWRGYGNRIAIDLDNSTYECWVSFYDETGSISGTGYIGCDSIKTGIHYIPKNAVLIGISFRRVNQEALSSSDITAISSALKCFAPTDTTMSINGMAADAKAVGDTICDRVDISGTTWETGAINQYGNVYTSGVGTDKASDYIPVYAPSTIYIPNVDLRSGRYIAGYDGNKNFLRTLAGGTETEYHKSVTITPQADVKYIRITSHQDYYTNNTYLKYSNINKAIYDARDSLKNEVDAELNSFNSAMEYVNVFYLNNEATRTVSDVEISVLEDGSIKLNGTASADIYLNVMGGNRTSQIPCAYAGETYTFKRTLVSGTQSTNPRFWHAGENTDAAVFIQNSPYTLTEDEWFYLRLNSGTVFTNAVYQIMMVKGEKMLPYLPHKKTAIDEVARIMAGTVAPKTIKILGVGNSYTGNCTRWLYRILKEAGYEDFVVGAWCYYSHSLKQIYNSVINPEEEDFSQIEYIKYYGNSQISATREFPLDDALGDEAWDVVVLQQSSYGAGHYETYVSDEFDFNDLIQHIKDHVETENLKFGLCEPWTHSTSYYDHDPSWWQTAIEEVTPLAANHMTDCDYVVHAGQAVKLARQNPILDTLGDHLCRPEDHTHIQYGIPSWMCGVVYAITICGIKPCDLAWYAKAANEGHTSNVTETGYMAYLAKQCALQASQMIN